MSKIQHSLAEQLLPILRMAIPPHAPLTYKGAAKALGRDPAKNARMVAQVCDLLDAAAAFANVPSLALTAVQETSGRINHKAWAGESAPPWLREAIIERSLQHKFTNKDFAAIAQSLHTLSGLGNRAAWKRFSSTVPREERYRRLTGLDASTITKLMRSVQSSAFEAKTPHRYWAFVADPRRYRIIEAVSNVPTDTWTTKGRPINLGDHAIIWQSRDRAGRRGIVALAEIVKGPNLRSDSGNPYWIDLKEGNAITERVGLRYIKIAGPLWSDGSHHGVLKELAVFRARGGTVFHVTPAQWEAVASFVQDAQFDIEAVRKRSDLKQTQREALIQARLGQGRFRRDLLKYWGGCAVIGCTVESVLRASHIKPWRSSSDHERLDPANGLLLAANLDALFNDGLITFSDEGQIIVSKKLLSRERSVLQIEGSLIKTPSARQRKYLKYHRKNIFVSKGKA